MSDASAIFLRLQLGSFSFAKSEISLYHYPVGVSQFMTERRSIIFCLLPLFIAAQLLCICSNAIAAGAKVVVAPVKSDAHACCRTDKASEPASSIPQHEHDDGCPHCGEQGAKPATIERAAPLTSELNLSPFELLSPFMSTWLVEGQLAQVQAFEHRVTATPPPPDLLRMKCTLQI